MNHLNLGLAQIGLLLLLCLTLGCTANGQPAGGSTGFPTSTPEKQDMRSEKLDEMLRFIGEEGYNFHSLAIVRNGHLLADVRFHPFNTGNYKHEMQSVTKSITGLMTGIAIKEGKIKSLEQSALDFFPDLEVEDRERKSDIKIKDLLHMASGLEFIINSETIPESWVQYIWNSRLQYEPGTKFDYNLSSSHLLAAIIEKATGKSLADYANEKLFGPLGITDVYWETDPEGITRGDGSLRLHTADLLKIGQLVLQNGQWEGKEILPANWFRKCFGDLLPADSGTEGEKAYGYQWWVYDFGGVESHVAKGSQGQYLLLFPDLDMMVAATAGLSRSRQYSVMPELVERFILPAVNNGKKPLEENSKAYQALQSTIAAIESGQPDAAGLPTPAVAAQVSGKTYQLSKGNPLDMSTWRFDFGNASDKEMAMNVGGIDVKVGLDGTYRINPIPQAGLNMALRGKWTDGDTFLLEMQELSSTNKMVYSIRFKGKTFDADFNFLPGNGNPGTSFSGRQE